MICFAACVSHPIISIPNVGQDNQHKITATIQGLDTIRQEIYATKPDSLIIITPHAAHTGEVFTINQQVNLSVDFRAYGDLATNIIVRNDLSLGYRLREQVESTFPLILTEEKNLDYGSAVPLFHLQKLLPTLPVVILGSGEKIPVIEHYKLGQAFKRVITPLTQRVAVIASMDLSHDQPDSVPASQEAFDRQVIAALEQQSIKILSTLAGSRSDTATECGLRPLAVLLGILSETQLTTTISSYERTLGIGYLTAYCQKL